MDAVNPFTRSSGSRIYDANATPVVPFHSVRQFVLTSDANGHGAVVLSPAWAEQLFLAPTVDVTNDMTALGAATVGVGYSATQYESYRIASMGVKVKSIVAPLSASGYVRATTDLTTVAHVLTNPANHFSCKTEPLRSANFVVLSRPTGIEAYETVPIATAADNYHGFTSITISLDGAPASTACCYVEVCVNYEAFPAAGQSQNSFAQKAAPAHSGLQNAIDNLRNHIGDFADMGAGAAAHSWLTGGTAAAGEVAETGGIVGEIGEWLAPVAEVAPELAIPLMFP